MFVPRIWHSLSIDKMVAGVVIISVIKLANKYILCNSSSIFDNICNYTYNILLEILNNRSFLNNNIFQCIFTSSGLFSLIMSIKLPINGEKITSDLLCKNEE